MKLPRRGMNTLSRYGNIFHKVAIIFPYIIIPGITAKHIASTAYGKNYCLGRV